MRFPEPLLEGRLVQRYKRFLADIDLATGERITAHCANPGAMLGLKEPGSRVLVSRAANPKRKLAYNWEFLDCQAGGGPSQLVGINTSRPNALVAEALREGRLAPFGGYDRIRPEVKYGRNSRIDFLLEKDGAPSCYLEVKNCHFMRIAGFAEFPDCVAARSAKHLYELADMVAAGARAALLYVIQMQAERFDVARGRVGRVTSLLISRISHSPSPNRACHFHGTRLSAFIFLTLMSGNFPACKSL